MLHRVEIENFYSIRERQVIDLRATEHVSNDDNHLAPAWTDATDRVPKVITFFGANASGKSNVLKALAFVAWFVKHSFSAPRGGRMPFDRFNHLDTFAAPARLAVQLSGVEDIAYAGNHEAVLCPYFYEVIFSGEPGKALILREALFYRPASAKRRLKLFERDSNGIVSATRAFGLSGFRQALDKILRPDASVIATLAQLDHPYAKIIWDMANRVDGNILMERLEISDEQIGRYYSDNPTMLGFFNQDIERIDLGIQSMQFQQGEQGSYPVFTHNGLTVPMPLILESHGTRQFIKIYPFLLNTLQVGGIAVIDELDAAIHPLILPEILRWFRDPARNPHCGQLWMTCHNVSLLEDLKKEEVFFCDKDDQGRTEIYGLSEIQSVRRGDNYYRKYLGGAFGAVPQIG